MNDQASVLLIFVDFKKKRIFGTKKPEISFKNLKVEAC